MGDIKYWGNSVNSVFYGSTPVKSIYYGSTLVWGQNAPVANIEISPNTSYYPTANGGSRTITVTSSGQWSASVSSSATSWLHISRSTGTTGQTCIITCDPQPDFSSRSGSVTFSCGASASQTVSVVQSGQEYSITVDPEEISCSSNKYTGSFSITANCDWTISTDGWIHTNVESGSGDQSNITVIVDANTGGARTGSIAVNEEDGHTTSTITVSQSAAPSQFKATPRAINWKYDSNDNYANKQSWQVEFKGGSANKTLSNVNVIVQSMDSGTLIEELVKNQTVTVPANQTVYLGLNDTEFTNPAKAQLPYDGFTVNDDPYTITVWGDGLSAEETYFDEQYIYD